MKSDDPLTLLLSGLTPPPLPDPSVSERTLYHATLALQGAAAVEPTRDSSWIGTMFRRKGALSGGVIAALLLVAGWSILSGWRKQEVFSSSLSAERRVLDQIEILFGAQLEAVVERPGAAPDIHLSYDPALGAPVGLAQPVAIQFDCPGSPPTRVISYSGRTVCLTLAGRQTCFEPLVTGQGDIILSGERFCWTSSRPSGGFDGYRVTARLLPRS